MVENLRIVLVEPAGPLNIGAIARVMKNFGLCQLVLVNPQCDPMDPAARQMAVHAQDVLTAATRVDTLPAALQGCHRAIATTARPRETVSLERPEQALPWLLTDTGETALIFGPEDRGLNNAELDQAQRFIKIPSDTQYPALNLAQAVAVCSYELSRQWQRQQGNPLDAASPPTLRNSPSSAKQTATASLGELNGYYLHLESVLLNIGYLYPHTATSRMRKIRHILHRAMPTSEELALLRGILRQVEWATQAAPSPPHQDSSS
jgi:tRNA/rRNA methyltransferase